MKRKFLTIILIVAILAVGFTTFYLSRSKSSIPSSSSSQNIEKPTNPIFERRVTDSPLTLPAGYTVHLFASSLGNPRVLVFSPGGTLLVSDPISNKVIALPDKNEDGVADSQKVVIDQGNNLHGLAFYNGKLYVANADNVIRYNWNEETLTASFDKNLFSLPENNNHNNRTLAFDDKGNLFISLGSTCNVCIESPQTGGSVLVSDEHGSSPTVFADGLRNAAFIKINPVTKELWGTEMGRDYLGDNLPPDEINVIRQGENYGWPYCYGNKIHDDSFDPADTNSCSDTQQPIYEIPAHNAPLGLVFINSPLFPTDWQGDLLVAYHGSWNSTVPVGYKVVHLKVRGNSVIESEDFMTGFLPPGESNGPSDAFGRPVDLVFDRSGNLYVSDDKNGNIYIIQEGN